MINFSDNLETNISQLYTFNLIIFSRINVNDFLQLNNGGINNQTDLVIFVLISKIETVYNNFGFLNIYVYKREKTNCSLIKLILYQILLLWLR